jgi:hypothetical protein
MTTPLISTILPVFLSAMEAPVACQVSLTKAEAEAPGRC